MRIFIIQPNYSSKSETWLHRMNTLLNGHICGMACYLSNEKIEEQFKVFNLNGSLPTRIERIGSRIGFQKKEHSKIIGSALLEFIIQNRPDAIIIHYATTAVKYWNILKLMPVPIYIYVHGFDIIWEHNDNNGNKIHTAQFPTKVMEISKMPNVKFIVSSNTSKQNLLSIGIEDGKIVKKVFGVEVKHVKRNYYKENMTILFLGRFVDFKGPDIVLNAFLRACEMGFKGKLIMAGDGVFKNMCELISKQSYYADRIEFTGAVNEEQANALYEQADIYSMHNCKGLLSNGYDTFGVTIIEAMSFGLPVVIGNFGGPAELIKNEFDGLFIEAGNVDDHAAAFMRLYNNRSFAEFLGSNAIKKVTQDYSLMQEKDQLYSILGLKAKEFTL